MQDLPIAYADLAILGVLLISGLLALVRGFVRELLHILAWIGAAVIAVKAFPLAEPLTAQYLQPPLLADLAAGAGLFVVSLIVLIFVFGTIARRVRESEIGWIDRLLGFVFGVVRGVLVLALAYMVLLQFLPPEESEQPTWLTASRGLPYVKTSATYLTKVAPEVFAAALRTIEQAGDAAQLMLEDTSATGTGGVEPTTEKRSETGYGAAPRQQMDRLIDSNR